MSLSGGKSSDVSDDGGRVKLSTKLGILRRCERHVGYYEAAWSPEYDDKKHMRLADKLEKSIKRSFKREMEKAFDLGFLYGKRVGEDT